MAPLALAIVLLSTPPPPASRPVALERIDVSAPGEVSPPSVTRVDGSAVAAIDPAHPSELFARIPGVWVSRGSAQELLTAIRSPVLTGTGACGAFLWSEDGVPLRPAGFCNVNGLFEFAFEQAASVEVLRGPGTALHGSNALHGVINVTSADALHDVDDVRITIGSDDYVRGAASFARGDGERGFRVDALATASGSFRDDEKYGLGKVRVRHDHVGDDASDTWWFSGTNLNQETAGYIAGRDAYRDDDARRANANPEAFRDARAARAGWRHDHTIDDATSMQVLGYARNDELRFIQHFALGKPLETDRDDSAGARVLFTRGAGRWQVAIGSDAELARGSTREIQLRPLTEGSPLQQAIRPAGVHYDYSATAASFALFADVRWRPSPTTEVELGWRGERLAYRYDNAGLDGNTRDDGTPCASGGCLFLRPADRDDTFTANAPKLGVVQRIGAHAQWHARIARGFRFPQASELYRLQRGQDVADLAPETLDSAEVGWSWRRDANAIDVVLYTMRKHDFLFRDAQGFNVSNGRTRHAGIEIAARRRLAEQWALEWNSSYSIQRYDFAGALPGGETITRDNEIDTAPRWLADARLQWLPDEATRVELEAQTIGSYFLDAANTERYPGHVLLNLRASRDVAPDWTVAARITNLADRRYAERADLAFGEHRYFPGASRGVFVSLEWRR